MLSVVFLVYLHAYIYTHQFVSTAAYLTVLLYVFVFWSANLAGNFSLRKRFLMGIVNKKRPKPYG